VPWQSAANKSSAADDPHLAFFSILVNKAAAEKDIQQLREKDSSSSSNVAFAFDDAPLQVADCLRIKAQLPWPLGVLITKQDLERYNKVFALLLKVKRVQLELEAAWQELGRCAALAWDV
jgi:gamma-tubulin complex component 4